RLHEPHVRANRIASIFERLDFGDAAGEAPGQVRHVREIASPDAMDRDMEARIGGGQLHCANITAWPGRWRKKSHARQSRFPADGRTRGSYDGLTGRGA